MISNGPSAEETKSIKRERRRVPGWPVWLGCAAALAAAWVMQSDYIDPTISLIFVRLGVLVPALILWMWFIRFSSYPPRWRYAVGWGVLALALVAAALVRVERTSGRLQVEFAWRWSPHHDELLDPSIPGTAKQRVDLATVSPDDFPQFLGPNRNSVLRGTPLERDWQSHPPRQLWQHEIGAGWSGFAAVHESAVTLEQRGKLEMVSCYDIETGELNWAHSVPARHETTLGYVGPRSTPTIHDGQVFALGATGILRCLDGTDGRLVWQRNLLQDHGISVEEAEDAVAWGRAASPLVYQDLVIVPLGGARQGKKIGLIALDRRDGTLRWGQGDYQAAYASPTLATLNGIEQILVVNEDYVSAHDPSTGTVLWDYPWPGKSNMDANVSQPAPVDEYHVLLSKGYGRGAELIEVRYDQNQWHVTPVWQNRRVMKTKFSNVALLDGMAYGLDDGILNCIDTATGERKWKKGRFGYGQILLVNDCLLVLSERGELALVEASPAGFHELGRIQALNGQTWNTLCLSGSHLLVRNSEMAACYHVARASAP